MFGLPCFRRAWILMAIAALPLSAAADERVSYRTHVRKVFRDHCASCHNTTRPRAGLDLSTYAGILQGSSSGSVLSEGDPDDSILYLCMSHEEEPFMPPGKDPVDDETLGVIRTWIQLGLPETADDVDPDALAALAKSRAESSEEAADASDAAGDPEMSAAVMPAAAADQDESAATSDAASGDERGDSLVFRGSRAASVVSLSVSSSGDWAAVGGQLQVLLFDLQSQRLARVLPFPEGEPLVLEFTADGQRLLAGGGTAAESGRVVVWDVATGERVREYGDEYDVVMAADIDESMNTALLGGPERVVKVLDATTGRTRAVLRKHTDWVLAAAFSPEGLIFATADRAGNVYVWETESGESLHTLRGHRGSVPALGWSPDGTHCLTGGEDGAIRIWDMHTGKTIREWVAHKEGVLSLSVAPDGRVLTSGRDRQVALWDADGTRVGSVTTDSLPLRVQFLDSQSAVIGTWDGRTVRWAFDTDAVLAALSIPEDRFTDQVAEIDLNVVSPEMPEPAVVATTDTRASVEAATASSDMGVSSGASPADGTIERWTLALVQFPMATAELAAAEATLVQSRRRLAALQESRRRAVESSESSAAGDSRDANADSAAALAELVQLLEIAHEKAEVGAAESEDLQDSALLMRIALEKARAELRRSRGTAVEQSVSVSKRTEGTPTSRPLSADAMGVPAEADAAADAIRQQMAVAQDQVDRAEQRLSALRATLQELTLEVDGQLERSRTIRAELDRSASDLDSRQDAESSAMREPDPEAQVMQTTR